MYLQQNADTEYVAKLITSIVQGGLERNGLFLSVDNLAMASGRKAFDMHRVMQIRQQNLDTLMHTFSRHFSESFDILFEESCKKILNLEP